MHKDEPAAQQAIPAWLFMRVILILGIVLILILVGGFVVEDNRSCRRQIAPRETINAGGIFLKEFMVEAAKARERTADKETGRLRQVDLDTAVKYRTLADKIKPVNVPSCTFPFH